MLPQKTILSRKPKSFLGKFVFGKTWSANECKQNIAHYLYLDRTSEKIYLPTFNAIFSIILELALLKKSSSINPRF